ncbi:hypothetical protein ACFUPZ_06470 [Microbacterium oxydans]|uniref:hypothetical protein n=1 Tax=Microbacterium oxydans TaxID=82380 RepID=UPI00362D836F
MPANEPASPPAGKPAKNQVKGAHMVSSGYINAWADKSSIIDVLDLDKVRGYPISFKQATIVNHVYAPAFLNHDLEGEYARTESSGIPVIKKLREGLQVTVDEQTQLIEFLEMHRYRGRYADRADVRVPAVAVMTDGTAKDIDLKVGDMTLLTRDRPPGPRLTTLGLEQQTWTVWNLDHILPTGDGAVMLWGSAKDDSVAFVTFILSPTQLLLIGDNLPTELPIKEQLVRRSMRWIVGKRGTLRYSQAAVIAAERAKERQAEAAAAVAARAAVTEGPTGHQA